MLYSYKAINQKGEQTTGEIEALGYEVAVSSLQKRGFIVVELKEKGEKGFLNMSIPMLSHVPLKDVVIMSRQISTLFEARVSAVKAFNLLSENVENQILKEALEQVSQDIQGGISLPDAMMKHPQIFSDFYVNMVRAGDESGKLVETFDYLAGYQERQHDLTSKTRSALIYPAFVVVVFIGVMVLMLTMIIPRLSTIILDSGQEIPLYTKVVIGMSDFLVRYGLFAFIGLALGAFGVVRYTRTESGKSRLDRLRLSLPYIGNLFRKIYLTRIADNMNTMLSSGIPVIHALEITSGVVGNEVYRKIIDEAIESVKGGDAISSAFAKHEEMPNILVQMIRVGEETGSLGKILHTLARFYRKEVDNAVDSLISLIEPFLIVMLAVGVGFLLTSVLLPIYNIATSI